MMAAGAALQSSNPLGRSRRLKKPDDVHPCLKSAFQPEDERVCICGDSMTLQVYVEDKEFGNPILILLVVPYVSPFLTEAHEIPGLIQARHTRVPLQSISDISTESMETQGTDPRKRTTSRALGILSSLPRTKAGISLRSKTKLVSCAQAGECAQREPLHDRFPDGHEISRATLDKLNSFRYRGVEPLHLVNHQRYQLSEPPTFANSDISLQGHENAGQQEYCQPIFDEESQYEGLNISFSRHQLRMNSDLQDEQLAEEEDSSSAKWQSLTYTSDYITPASKTNNVFHEQEFPYHDPNEVNTECIHQSVNASDHYSASITEYEEAGFATDSSEYYDEDLEDADFLRIIDTRADASCDCLTQAVTTQVLAPNLTYKTQEVYAYYDLAQSNNVNVQGGLTEESDDEFPMDTELFETSSTLAHLPSPQDTTKWTYDDTYDECLDDEIFESLTRVDVPFSEIYDPLPTTHEGVIASNGCLGAVSPKHDTSFPAEIEKIEHNNSYEFNENNCPERGFSGHVQQKSDELFNFPEGSVVADQSASDTSGAYSLPNYKRPSISSQQSIRSSLKLPSKDISATIPKGEFRKPRQAFLRSPFPTPVPDRSPIQGLTSTHTILRTCFRIGEALKVHFTRHQPSAPGVSGISPEEGGKALNIPPRIPSTTTILIELYALVASSYREGHRQFFEFADLFFPFQPPYLTGVWECWEADPLYDNDGKWFLGPGGKQWKRSENGSQNIAVHNSQSLGDPTENGTDEDATGRLCRVIGIFASSSRSPQAKPVEALPGSNCPTMTIFSIWRATWEDVEYVKGIVQI